MCDAKFKKKSKLDKRFNEKRIKKSLIDKIYII